VIPQQSIGLTKAHQSHEKLSMTPS